MCKLVFKCFCLFTCMYVGLCVCIYVCACVHIHVYADLIVHVSRSVCVRLCMCMHAVAGVCVCARKYNLHPSLHLQVVFLKWLGMYGKACLGKSCTSTHGRASLVINRSSLLWSGRVEFGFSTSFSFSFFSSEIMNRLKDMIANEGCVFFRYYEWLGVTHRCGVTWKGGGFEHALRLKYC